MRDEEGGGPKPREQWMSDEISAANFNAKAINVIFTYVDMNMFNLICTFVSAQDAWDKLQTQCEGSTSVKKKRIRLINSKFERMRIEENETIMQYNARLKSLANEASVLGYPFSNEILVSKVLCTLPKRFNMKVCAIDESKDRYIMGLDELISFLRNYEMDMEVQDDHKGNSIAFKVSKDSYTEFSEVKHEVMKEKKKSEKGAQPSKFPILPTSEKPQKPATTRGPHPKYESKNQSSSKNFDNIQCRECRGYVHYVHECVNRLRKSMNIILGRYSIPGCEDSEEEQEKNEQVDLISFTVLLESKKNFQVAKMSTMEGVQKIYEELYSDWIKRNKINTTLSKDNVELKAVVARLKVLMSKKDMELGLVNNIVFDIGESSKSLVFVKEGNKSLSHPSVVAQENCYFDSGSSRHMTGLKEHLTDYVEKEGGRMTYGGGAKGRIVGKGTLNVEGFPKLHNVLHLGHVNFKTLKNLSKFEAVRGLPNLKSGVSYICGACQKYLKGKTAEDDIDGLLEIPLEEHSVVPDVTTPSTTLVPPETEHQDNCQSDEEIVVTEKDIPSKIQKNHPPSQIIEDVHGTRKTRAKDKVD
ncbi:uncharacterized protein [Henckelia pumila]|uniref:uncharacterized protein n=1 Tax=Henckelia pumila TaxID=405737 RepID=UPI003C6E1A08